MTEIPQYLHICGFIEEGLRVAVVAALILFLVKSKRLELEPKYKRWMLTGLVLILFGNMLDFSDEIRAIDHWFILGKESILHDVFEDLLCNTLGIVIFFIGSIAQIIHLRKSR